MKYHAVIDTNVLVSSMLTRFSDSPVVKVVSAIRNKTLIPMYNNDILAEYSTVLNRERFHFDKQLVDQTISLIVQNGINCDRAPISEVFPDPDDIVFYEVALSRDDSYLVTGNLKHFPRNCRVVSPKDMLEIIAFGELRSDILSDAESPLYLPIPLEEINAIIAEVRRLAV